MTHRVRLGAAALVAGLFVVLVAGEGIARRAEDVFAGKVVILKKRPPLSFKSADGFIGFLRTNSVQTVYADGDNTWTFETMAFFHRPLGDLEVDMVFYDVTNGGGEGRFVDTYTQYTQDRNTRVLSGKCQLIRPTFDANKSYNIVVQHQGTTLARGHFSTKGISQDQLDNEKRVAAEMVKMEESMKDLQKKVDEQKAREEAQKKDQKAADDLF
jgi:hypothetical protein